ncbi:uncharacterized protein B0H64DRAFT_330575 [Chaetomium fimeti]|uniref:Uncharacterized protein n=1 Tax=Chaetomium fimeti TaxID=1854472 RepID=A0AAE0LNK1_9PEZI|nr:hypothetical protein B0H64DRAFT_330575 [Chaetomium fimeti]
MAPFGSLFLLPFLFVSIFADPDHCFFPDGTTARFAASCWNGTSGQTVLCCQTGDLCLSNQICAMKDHSDEFHYYRGACIDSNWTDPGCPDFCPEPAGDDQIVPMHRCSGGKTMRKWYCGNGNRPADLDCKDIDGDVELPENISVYATAGITPKPSPSPTPSRDPPESKDTASAIPPSNTIQFSLGEPVTAPGPDTPNSQTAAPPSTLPNATGTDVPTAVPTAVPSDPPQDDDDQASSAVPVAVGVAVGTSILIAGSVLVFFYQRKRRRQAPVRAETPPPFEFSFINNQPPGWLGPSSGAAAKVPVAEAEGKMHDESKPTPEIGGTARYEMP